MLSDPGGAAHVCPYVTLAMVPSGFSIPSATSQIRNNGAQSLQPDGLRPAPSLSTLSPRRYRRKPKTRYGMCWVGTLPVALAACLPCPFWGKASNFRGLFEFLLCYVATINIAYIEIFS